MEQRLLPETSALEVAGLAESDALTDHDEFSKDS